MKQRAEETENPLVEIRRLRRRMRRNMRKARAEGLLSGIAAMLGPKDVVCDLGANVGDITAQLAATGTLVHAFEPDPWCIAQLQARFAQMPNVIIHQVAAGAKDDTIRLHRATNFEANPKSASVRSTIVGGGRMISKDDDAAIDVRVIDFPAFLDDLIARHGRLAFIKMDIEGAELDLLEAMEARDQFKDVQLTVVETHENKFKHLRPRFEALRTRFGETLAGRVDLDWI